MCHGGGVHCQNRSNPTIRNCVFIANRSRGHGAAVYTTGSSPSFVDCIFEDNRALAHSEASGAAMSLWGMGAPEIQRCRFIGNRAARGGGAIGLYGAIRSRIVDCTFLGNEAGLFGGGDIECSATSAPKIEHCTFYGAAAPAGAAIHCKDRSQPTVERSIIAFCGRGDAIRCIDGSSVILRCSNLYGNEGGDWVGCIETQLGSEGNSCEMPLFVDPLNGDVSLRPESPLRMLAGCGAIGVRPTDAR